MTNHKSQEEKLCVSKLIRSAYFCIFSHILSIQYLHNLHFFSYDFCQFIQFITFDYFK